MATTKEEAIARICGKYLDDYKKYYREEDRIRLFEDLIREAEENDLPDYVLCFRGFREWAGENLKGALDYFNESTALNPALAYPWHGLGNAYDDLKEYDKALKSYQKAIVLDETFALPWNGLGVVYNNLKEYDEAIKSFQKALSLDENYAHPYRNLALTYQKLENHSEAVKCFEKALALFKEQNDPYLISVTEINLQEARDQADAQARLLTGAVADESPLLVVLQETIKQKIDEKARENKSSFSSFIKEGRRRAEEKDDLYLEVLRRWNSYTPIIADNYHISKGGGYFIKTAQKGIVIDPGFNFIDNFKGAGHFFAEIDAVFISHAHNDHTTDLESILTLLYKYK